MRIHFAFDDSAARLPLAIRSSEGVFDRAADLRSAPGVQLVEITTQHVLNTGTSLIDELAHYFEMGGPSEADPYALAACYAQRELLEDLLRDLRDRQDQLTAFHEVEALFPASFTRDLSFALAFTVVGVPAFGYVRSFKDSEGEEYHGMVVNLAQAGPTLRRSRSGSRSTCSSTRSAAGSSTMRASNWRTPSTVSRRANPPTRPPIC